MVKMLQYFQNSQSVMKYSYHDGAVKLISLVVPSLEIANKIQFRHLYQLVNPRGKNKYKSYDVIEVWAEDVHEVSLK